MITIETNRTTPVYSNLKGKEKAVKEENRLFTDTARSERKSARTTKRAEIKDIRSQVKSGQLSREEARKLKRKTRKAKAGAIKLQLTKRFTKDGKPLFVYRLKKVFKDIDGVFKKILPDGRKVKVKKEDIVTTAQGTYDANDISKASGVSVQEIKSNPSTVDSVTTTVTQSSSGSEIATETTNSASADLAVEVPTENVVNTTTGEVGGDVSYQTGDDVFIEEETLPATNTETTDTTDTTDTTGTTDSTETTKTPMKTWEKVLLFGGIAVVLGLVTFAIVKAKKK
jgi:hypothetical protein